MKNVFFVILLFLISIFCSWGNEPSIMASGNWYKITVERDGIYRITYSELQNLGITDPANVRIYGKGGSMSPEKASKYAANDLQEIPIWMHTRDGTFKNGDYIIFYGQGPAVWHYNKEKKEFEHSIHLWDNQTSYFITSKAGGKKIITETPPATNVTHSVTSFDERQFHENESINLLNSGRYWYGEYFEYLSTSATQRFPFVVPDIDTNAHAWLNISFMAQTVSYGTQLHVKYNGQAIASEPLHHYTNNAITSNTFNTADFIPASDALSMELTISAEGAGTAIGRLDYIRLFARRKLNMSAAQLFFRDVQSVGEGQTATFQLTGSNSNIHVWDISDMHNIRRMETSLSGATLSFTAATDSLREFVAFNSVSDLLRPRFPEKNRRTENQNLHGIENAEMIIVTHPDFLDSSLDLAALHRSRDNLAVEVVTAEQVYNEFSSGMQDPAAIRNFMKHLYEKPSSVKLKYLLLMGTGSYDNKSNGTNAAFNKNFIVTYQSENSWHSTNSYVSDDYFGVLGDGEDIETGMLAIGVGRLPVRTAEQAKEAVAKTRRYMDAAQSGDWQNFLGLLAEDGDNNLHTSQSENLARYMNENHPQYTVEKMYLSGSPRVVTVDGHRFPELEERLMNLINSGCLLVNYIGHGSTSGLSTARVVNNTSIGQWKNKLYPVFVAATCDFGRYDSEVMSGSETMLLKPDGGSIASLASTRLVYSNLNFDFNRNFFIEMLTRPAQGDDSNRLGDIIRRAKNASVASVNKLCFTLLGNPALKPVIPENFAQTVSINGIPVSEPLDTLKAGSFVTVKGVISDYGDNVANDFNGVLHFSLFDKAREHQTLNHNGEELTINFITQPSTLFKGKAAVENGEFEISFIVPRNINYQYGFGKITYFAVSDDEKAAAGTLADITVGGSVAGSGNMEGPQIRLFMNDIFFRDGCITDSNPRLIAFLQDEKGINTSQESIGNDITAILSNDPSKIYTLNKFYEADLDSHNKGVVSYMFTNLPAGNYELLFTAWNIENNPSQESIRFRVTQSMMLKIDKLYSYPNPFNDRTSIYFEYNMPDTKLQVELQIFDMSGRMLRSMHRTMVSEGYTSGDFEWDRHDANGNRMDAGIYPYRVILTTERGQTVWQASRMVIEN